MNNFFIFHKLVSLRKIFLKLSFVLLSIFFAQHSFAHSDYYSFELKNLQNKSVSFEDFRGKYVFIDFWATWCPPCKRQLVNMDHFFKKNPNNQCIFAIVSVDSNIKQPQEYMKEHYPELGKKKNVHLLFSGKSGLPEIFEVRGIPSLFLMGKNGKIIWKHVGTASVEEIESVIKEKVL